jgi:rubrerythrin
MASTHAELGMNRTGTQTSRELTSEMLAGTQEFGPTSQGNEQEIAFLRQERAKQAEPLGHVPPPLSAKGALKTAATAIKGEAPTQLIDKMGERLGFERVGVRLYQAMLTKVQALGTFDGGPSVADVQRILDQEYEHFRMLEAAIQKMGADPTVITPSADLHATMTSGVLKAMVDDRTTVPQCLEAALIAELADNDCWEALMELCEQAGETDLSTQCQRALSEEREHLFNVRAWLRAAQGRQVPTGS